MCEVSQAYINPFSLRIARDRCDWEVIASGVCGRSSRLFVESPECTKGKLQGHSRAMVMKDSSHLLCTR